MDQFLRTIVTFPVVPMTILLGVVLCYWLFVIVGAVGMEGGSEGVSAGAKAAGEGLTGAIKGMGEGVTGALKGAGEGVTGAVKGAGEAATGAAKAVGSDNSPTETDGGLLTMLGLGKIPITITGSSMIFFAWILSIFGTNVLGGGTLIQSGVLLGSLVLGLMCSAVVLQPLRKVFDGHAAVSRRDLRGKICVISSGSVEKAFGTATIEDGGSGLMIHVTCSKANPLKKGDRALIIDFDPQKDSYEIEPIDWLMPGELEALNDPAKASSVLDARIRQR
jgi:hypothetical protein